MKKLNSVLITVFLLSALVITPQATAQKSESEKEKEKQIEMAIEQQKKTMSEQYKAQEEALKEAREIQIKAKEDVERSMQDMNIEVITEDFEGDEAKDILRVYGRRGDRSFRVEEPMVWSSSGSGDFRGFVFNDNNQMTRWDYSRNVRESTFSNEYRLDVEKTANSVVMSVNGNCREGEIVIKITMPNGKTYSEILIDESGSLNWRKSFSISESENQDKTGEWKYKISGDKASGYFKISLQTN